MRPILLVTAPYTGSRFFVDLLEKTTGLEAFRITNAALDPWDGYEALAWGHFDPRLIDRYQEHILQYDPIFITTQRDNDKVLASWKATGKANNRMLDFNNARDWLLNKYKPITVSVDAEERDEMLKALSTALDLPITTDWTPVGARAK